MSESTREVSEDLTIPSEFMLTDEKAATSAQLAGSATADEQPAATGWSLVRELLETVILSLVIFLVIRQGVQNYRIESHSMQPNFFEGQFVLVNKLAYKLGEPDRGDVVVFRNPGNENEDYIKRVVGKPGDTIQFADGEVYVNGEYLDEPFVNAPTLAPIQDPIVVSPDHLFVMGDNRPNSRDSRSFGLLDEDLLVGRAWVRVWPISEWGRVGHLPLEPGVPFEQQE